MHVFFQYLEAPPLRLPRGFKPKNVTHSNSNSDFDITDSEDSDNDGDQKEKDGESNQKVKDDVRIDVLMPAVSATDVEGEMIGHWEERLNMFEKLILARNFAEEKVRLMA